MNLLITGCCGHIGSYIIENVHRLKGVKKTFAIDNLESNRFGSLFKLNKKNNLKFFLRDLKNKNSLKNLKKIDVVIHCASITNAEKSFERQKEMYDNNIGAFINILKFCNKNKSKLIHLSSASIYGKQSGIVKENCEKKYIKPQSPYAKIKLIEEKLLKKNNNKIKYNIFRLGTISGVSKGIRFHTAVNKFCLHSSINEPIEVYKTALNQYRPYLSIRDIFDVFKFCLEKDFFKNDIFNILSGNFTVNQILKKIKKYQKKKIKIKFVKSAIMNQLSYHVSRTKFDKEGFILKNKIDTDIKDTIKLLNNI